MFEEIPEDFFNQLNGHTLNTAIEAGLITDLGDDKGRFIFREENDPDTCFALIQGYAVQCSKELIDSYSPEEINDILGDLSLFKYNSNGRSYFRLGRPRYLNIGDVVVSIAQNEIVASNEDNLSSTNYIQFTPLSNPPKNPSSGTLYFDKSKNTLCFFNGLKWKEIS